ncbi:MAG: GDYXXLXY domain-containing protein [Elusimicrobiales bacterium]|nr:GDYXXLXY domain-containing protein [Elusimicrobiales bacterium]
MKKLKITLIIQLVFFAAWATWLMSNDMRAEADFWIETMPVDPRDYLSGNYVALHYDMEAPQAESCKEYDSYWHRNKKIYVKLVPEGEKILKNGNSVIIHKAEGCYASKEKEGLFIPAKVMKNRKMGRNVFLQYENLNRFYMNENDKKLNISSGNAAVHVQKSRLGRLKITEIEEIDKKITMLKEMNEKIMNIIKEHHENKQEGQEKSIKETEADNKKEKVATPQETDSKDVSKQNNN